jgi:hypothetical protein
MVSFIHFTFFSSWSLPSAEGFLGSPGAAGDLTSDGFFPSAFSALLSFTPAPVLSFASILGTVIFSSPDPVFYPGAVFLPMRVGDGAASITTGIMTMPARWRPSDLLFIALFMLLSLHV